MYGYVVNNGYKGRMPDGTWQLFATETEYIEEYREYVKKDRPHNLELVESA